jgi:hypothetical protein
MLFAYLMLTFESADETAECDNFILDKSSRPHFMTSIVLVLFAYLIWCVMITISDKKSYAPTSCTIHSMHLPFI